jgi:mannose-6-phosphate isomerase-like protein (cupin superfamily)
MTPPFQSAHLPLEPTAQAPDGSQFRALLRLPAGSLAHFSLPAGAVSRAVTHRSVEEIWYVLSGAGEMWRRHGEHEAIDGVQAGSCLTIPLGTHFQFRCTSDAPLCVVVITLPPWTADDEAVQVSGPWASCAG